MRPFHNTLVTCKCTDREALTLKWQRWLIRLKKSSKRTLKTILNSCTSCSDSKRRAKTWMKNSLASYSLQCMKDVPGCRQGGLRRFAIISISSSWETPHAAPHPPYQCHRSFHRCTRPILSTTYDLHWKRQLARIPLLREQKVYPAVWKCLFGKRSVRYRGLIISFSFMYLCSICIDLMNYPVHIPCSRNTQYCGYDRLNNFRWSKGLILSAYPG